MSLLPTVCLHDGVNVEENPSSHKYVDGRPLKVFHRVEDLVQVEAVGRRHSGHQIESTNGIL